MPTTAELLALGGHLEVALVMPFDGIEIAFTDHRDLVGLVTGAGHDVRLGLQRNEGLTMRLAINLRDGQWLDSPARVSVMDFSRTGDLAALFLPRATVESSLGDVPIGAGLPVHPSSDLTGRPDLDETNIGLERIGANGARHQFAVPPGFAIGLEHSITTPSLDIAGAPVSDSPIVWIGRRAAIYLMVRDHVTYPDRSAGAVSWRPFSEAVRLWCGTTKGPGRVVERLWTFELEGPDSLLRKPLATGMSSKPVRAVGNISLVSTGDTIETGMFCRLATLGASYGSREWVATISATDTDGIRDDVIAEIAATEAAAGTDGAWEDQAGFRVFMTQDGAVSISVADGTPGPAYMSLGLHRKVWDALGYDVQMQGALFPDWGDARAIEFFPADVASYDAPGPDYWIGNFLVAPVDGAFGSGDNNGYMKTYQPYYDGGTNVLLSGLNEGRGQIFRLDDAAIGGDGTAVAHTGQLAWPVASDPNNPANPIQIDGIDCDRCGLWIFTGKRRYRDTEEVFDERWIGLASWTNGSAQEDGLVARNSIIVTRWLDPELFGYVTKGGIDDDWVARDESTEGQVSAIPLAWLGYQLGLDVAHIVLQRLLYSTGTSTGWDSYENDDPTHDAGDNEPAIVLDGQRRDAEIADLGLAIPEDWIEVPADWDTAVSRIENAAILDGKSTFTAGYQAEDVIRSMMQPAGLAWHFRGGRFGVWCPADPLTLADVDVVLTPTVRVEKHSEAGNKRLVQEPYKWLPVDKWKVASNWQPFEKKVGTPFEAVAPDPQLRYRPGESVLNVQAHSMRRGGNGFAERLMLLSRWFAQPHFEVRGYPVEALRPGLNVWPGTVCRITDAELIDPATGYGVTNRIAIVTATQRTFDTDECRMEADLLVLATRTSTPRLNAPVAQTWGYNSATGRLYVSDDWAGHGNGWADASVFVEPAYTDIAAIGGNATVQVWQWDGSTWAAGLTGTVTGAVTTAGAAYLTLTSTSGTYYRDRDGIVVLRPSTVSNAAFATAIFSPVAADTGLWTDSAAASQAVYPWED